MAKRLRIWTHLVWKPHVQRRGRRAMLQRPCLHMLASSELFRRKGRKAKSSELFRDREAAVQGASAVLRFSSRLCKTEAYLSITQTCRLVAEN